MSSSRSGKINKSPMTTTTTTATTSSAYESSAMSVVVREEEPDADEQHDEQHDEALEVVAFDEIEKLETVGIAMSDILKLKAGGVYTIMGLRMRTKRHLCGIRGLTEAKVDKIVEAAAKIDAFITGNEMRLRRKEVVQITTGSSCLDEILGGGIETKSITEAFGEFRCGKTQLCHTLCVTAQLPREMGGGNGKVAYIDTEGTFRPERIAAIAERFGVNVDDTLDNIIVGRAYTHEHQMDLICEVAAKMVEDQFRLLIVDSIMALFRVDYSGRGELAERQQKLGRMLSMLQKMADEFNIAVFITNHVVSDPGAGLSFIADPKKPIGGHVLAHASTTRLQLRKGKGEQRICKIYDSPAVPEAEATFEIASGGVVDAKE